MDSKKRYTEEQINLIIDYLSNSISEPSRVELEEWLNESEANRQFFKELEEAWTVAGILKEGDTFESNEDYQLFRSRIELASSQPKLTKDFTRRFLPYVAAVASLIIFSFSIYFYTKQPSENKSFVSKIEVPYGSISHIELSDGTKVCLNAGSKLYFSGDFGQHDRKVSFEGEASFEVARNEKLPFIVQTESVSIKVLGTTFNVNTYQEAGDVKIALLEGKVELLSDAGESVHMKTNDMAVYNKTSQKITIYSDGVKDAFGWRENQLIFNNETFEQIAFVLERKFNVKFNIQDNSIKKRRFKGDFVNNETLEQILNIMCTDKTFKYKINGDIIHIYK